MGSLPSQMTESANNPLEVTRLRHMPQFGSLSEKKKTRRRIHMLIEGLEIAKGILELINIVYREIPKKHQRPDLFLNYDYSFLCKAYKDEPPLLNWIPYREEVCWIRKDIKETLQASQSISVVKHPDKFLLDGTRPELRSFQEQLKLAIQKDGRFRRDENVIRLATFDHSGDGTFTIQLTKYGDQVRSNLGMDWEGHHELKTVLGINSLRGYLSASYGSILPPLSDTRLANTVGIAAIILYRNSLGEYVPYIPRRKKVKKDKSKNVGVYTLGQFHCTASGAAAWHDECSFNNIFTDDMYREMNEEVGLSRNDIQFLTPVAYCREFLRGGKPQLFFVGYTALSADQLKQKRKARIELQQKDNPGEIEIEDEELVVSSFLNLEKSISKHSISLEGLANLYYAGRFAHVCRAAQLLPNNSLNTGVTSLNRTLPYKN
jgi:hypothetical protein